MSGILLIAVFIFWLIAAVWISQCVTRRCKTEGAKVVCALLLFPIIFIAPVVDEIVGGHQFSQLCEKYAAVEIDEEKAMNRRVYVDLAEEYKYADGTLVEVRINPHVYRDADTNEIIVKYHTLHAGGGWLIRFLGISETDSPLLFNRGCAPLGRFDFKEKYNIKVVRKN